MSDLCPFLAAAAITSAPMIPESVDVEDAVRSSAEISQCMKDDCQLWWFCSGAVLNVSGTDVSIKVKEVE